MNTVEKLVAEWASKNGFIVRSRGDFVEVDAVLYVENGLIRCGATISYSSLVEATDPQKELSDIKTGIHRRLDSLARPQQLERNTQ